MKKLLTSLLALACAATAAALEMPPRLVRLGDLNTSPVVAEPTAAGGAQYDGLSIVFSGRDSEHGEEIWQMFGHSDARLLVDVRPGPQSSSPREFAPLQNHSFAVVVDDGVTGPEVAVINASGYLRTYQSGHDLCPGRDHAAPRLLGRALDIAWYILADGADPFGRRGESLWQFESGEPPLWLETFKVGTVQQPRYGRWNSLLFVGQPWNEPEIGLFQVGPYVNGRERLGQLGDPAVALPLPAQVYAVTSGMVCYRGFSGSQPMLRAFRLDAPSNVLSYPLSPVMDPSFTSNGHDRICYAAYDPATGIEPWMLVDDFSNGPLTPQLVVDASPNTSPSQTSRLTLQGGILYFETGTGSRVLKFVDTTLTNRIAHDVFVDSEFITRRQVVSANGLAFVVTSRNVDSLRLYNTTSRTSQTLAQNIKVRELWAAHQDNSGDYGLNALIEDGGQDQLWGLAQNNSWNSVAIFVLGSAKPLPIASFESYPGERWVIGDPGNGRIYLRRYYSWGVGGSTNVPMVTELSQQNASSHPADIHEVSGHLFLTAVTHGERVLFHSPDGAQDSLQPVPFHGAGPLFEVDEIVKLGNQLFLRSAADGSLCRSMVEPAPVGAVVRPVLDGASPIPAERLTVAAGKVFFVQTAATTETLRFMNPDLTLGTVQVFQKPASGQAITQMTGTPDRLYFTAPANPNVSTEPVILWSTAGSGSPALVPCPEFRPSPMILGLWGGRCAFWHHDDNANNHWELVTWTGMTGQGVQGHWDGYFEHRPESSHTPGFPSGIEFDGRFVFCDREGGLFVLGPSGLEYDWQDSARFVRPECLSVLNGKLVWKAYNRMQWDAGLWESSWHCWNAASGFDFIEHGPGAASPLRSFSGRFWSVTGSLYQTFVTSWNGLDDVLQVYGEPLHAERALGDVVMGTYRERMVLAWPHPFAENGLEPMLLLENTTPTVTDPLKRTGARPGMPFSFTYEDILTRGIADAESDPLSLSLLSGWYGSLKVNGTAVSSYLPLNPGDIFEWTPTPSDVGDVPAFWMRASDPWDYWDFLVVIRVETPHEEWTRQHFTPAQLADPLVSGPEADADGDGVSNALEFLFGRLPHQREGEHGWQLTSTSPAAGLRRAVFTFNRLAVLPQGTNVVIEQSEELQFWYPVAEKLQNAAWTFPVAGVSVEEVTLPDGRIETRVTVEESASLNRFLRLCLVLP